MIIKSTLSGESEYRKSDKLHISGKKIISYSLVFTFLFVGYEPVKDIVAITMDTIKLNFSSASAGSKNTKEHWPVSGWRIKDLSTASKVKYLSNLEKDVILHLNMVRSNPPKYARDFIAPRSRYYKGKLYREPWEPSNFAGYVKQEGVEAVRECVSAMEQTSSVALLRPSKGLTLAAADHAVDQFHTGDTGHIGSDGSKTLTRFARHGWWQTIMGENISYGPVTGREIVVGLLVDDGIRDRGHRENILNSQFRVVGVSIQKHPVYRYVCVIDFAGAFYEN